MSVLASKDRGVDSRADHNTFKRQEELRGYQISPNSLHLSEANVNKSESKWEQHYSHFVNDKNTGESVREYSKNVFISFDGHGWGHLLSDEGGVWKMKMNDWSC